MADRFTETHMMRLVEIYKDYDSLWDAAHDLYKNREARETAYKEIVKKLNIPGLSVKDIPQKIKNLRSSYYQEIKKIHKSIKEGATGNEVYKPKVSWFNIVDKIISGSHQNSLIRSDPIDKLKSVRKDSTQATIASLDKIAENLTHQQNLKPQSKNEEDEYDSFGKYIAMTLRTMPKEMSIIARTELQKTLSDVQLRSIRQSNLHILPQQYNNATCSVCHGQLDYVPPDSNYSVPSVKTEFEITE